MPENEDEKNLTPKKNSKSQKYPVHPREMTTGEMHTLRELIDTFGTRLTLRVHEFKKQQVWEMHAESDALAKYVEQRLEKQRQNRSYLETCFQRPLTNPPKEGEDFCRPATITYMDGLRKIELYLLKNPLNWDGQGKITDSDAE